MVWGGGGGGGGISSNHRWSGGGGGGIFINHRWSGGGKNQLQYWEWSWLEFNAVNSVIMVLLHPAIQCIMEHAPTYAPCLLILFICLWPSECGEYS